jgi:hypothetical protein
MENPPHAWKRSEQITGPERIALRQAMRALYEAGESIRTIAEGHGRSYGFVRQMISESGATFRPKGGSNPRRQPAR